MSNLDFADRYDIRRFKKRCEDQRRIAEKWPAYDPRMGMVEEYRWRLGPWAVCFMLETWKRPTWHGSAAILEEIAQQTVVPSKWGSALVEIPQDALLATASWVPEHYEQARFILAEVFGPILRPGDDQQEALETVGLWGLHWHLKYEGKPPEVRYLH